MATDKLINSSQGDSIITALNDIKTAINNQSTAATATPLMDGTATVGTSTKYARENHVHPTDTSRAANVMSNYAVDTARENISTSSTVQGAIEQLEYREELNKTNILLEEEQTSQNLIDTSASVAVSGITFTQGTNGYISASSSSDSRSWNYANAQYKRSLPAGEYVILVERKADKTSGNIIYVVNKDTTGSLMPDVVTLSSSTFTSNTAFTLTTRTNIGVMLKVYSDAARVAIIPKSLWDSGVTSYADFAATNSDLTTLSKQNQTNILTVNAYAIPEMPSGNLTDSNVERDYDCRVVGYATDTNLCGRDGWCYVDTLILNSNATRRLQKCYFSDGVTKTRFYGGSPAAWGAWV